MATAAAGGLSACTSTPATITPGPTSEPRPGADESARRTAAATELMLAGLTRALSTRFATDKALAAAALTAGRAHDAHAAALLEGLSTSRSPKPSGSSSASTSPSASSSAPALPATASAAVTAVVQAETSAAAGHQHALSGVSGPLARLLASVQASDLAVAASMRPASLARAAG